MLGEGVYHYATDVQHNSSTGLFFAAQEKDLMAWISGLRELLWDILAGCIKEINWKEFLDLVFPFSKMDVEKKCNFLNLLAFLT